MTNWVTNKVTIRGDDQAALAAMANVLETSGELFQHLIPCPEDLINTGKTFFPDTPEYAEQKKAQEEQQAANIAKYGFPTWYEFNHQKWGTKWDACDAEVLSLAEGELTVLFNTAWCPPIPIFDHLTKLGFSVEAYWYEEGIQSWGNYIDGEGEYGEPDNWSEYRNDGPLKFFEDAIPSNISDAFPELSDMIEEYQADWEEEQEEQED